MSSSTASATTTPATTSNKNHNNENTRPEQKRTGRRRQNAVGKDEYQRRRGGLRRQRRGRKHREFQQLERLLSSFAFFTKSDVLVRCQRYAVPSERLAKTRDCTPARAFMNIFCLGVYGVLQERVMTIPYESSKNNDELGTQYPDAIFASSIFLVLSNQCARLFVGCVALFYTSSAPSKASRHHPFSKKKYWWWPDSSLENYACVAFSNLMSTLCQYEVLKYLSYAISTLAKAAKILPTMFWGFILHGRRFRSSQYLSAMLVTVGCFVFVFNSSLAAKYTSEGITTEDEEGYDNPYTNNNRLDDGDDNANEHGVLSEDPVVSAIFKEENDINAVFWKERALVVRRSSFQRAIGTFRSFARHSVFIGVCITLVYLTAGRVYQLIFQQRMFRVQKTSLFDQMFWTCVFGTFFSAAWVALSGQLNTPFYLTSIPENHPGHILFIHGFRISAGVNHVYRSRVWCGHVGVCDDCSTSRFDFLERFSFTSRWSLYNG